uniref:Uncharacterized protein n=1 Tax=Nelumbo nucifera TaxID=4432 RepID=A0A822YK54_NELNU|nr:TPA_asm: hypothetical protein HUJ06_011344 [Nelumbo nucifera]
MIAFLERFVHESETETRPGNDDDASLLRGLELQATIVSSAPLLLPRISAVSLKKSR